MLVGNDVVDLRAPRAVGKAADERFLRRVFSDAERHSISVAPSPDLMLWLFWAGKEAAYKVARKVQPEIAFAHRLFEVSVRGTHRDGIEVGPGVLQLGVARVPGSEGATDLRLSWQITDSYVHCVATSDEAATPGVLARVATLESLERASAVAPTLTVREAKCVRWPASASVRWLARALAAENGAPDVEIVREPVPGGFGPPRIFASGAPAPLPGWDVSLSHDGDFVAAVISHP